MTMDGMATMTTPKARSARGSCDRECIMTSPREVGPVVFQPIEEKLPGAEGRDGSRDNAGQL
jgi:hypothetical protein